MRPLHRDTLLALVMTAALLAEAASQLHLSPRPALTIALLCVIGASLVGISRAPAAAAAVALVALALYVRLAEVPDWTLPLVVIAAEFFALGLQDWPMRRLLVVGGALVTASFGLLALDPEDSLSSAVTLVANTALVALLPLAVGRVLHNRRLLARELRVRADQLRRERDERAQRAAGDERSRIARELHDVVAHSVSVMVIQAQGAQRVAVVEPGVAREALEAIERSGRDALQEMRAMIGVMRGPDADAVETAAGLAQLPALAERGRAAGLDVELVVATDLPELPLELNLLAYRVVQEALTNSIKHAGPAHVTVSVRSDARRLVIEVTDDGRPGDARNTTGAGHGLIGMRERLALYGGELHAGSRPGGGFGVTASVALDAAPTTADRALAASAVPARPDAAAPGRWRSWARRIRTALSGPRFDIAFGVAVAVMAAVDLLASHHRHGSVALNLLMAVLFGLCLRVRRTHALVYAVATIAIAVLCTTLATDVRTFPLAFYLLLCPAYALAVYDSLGRGLLGLAVLMVGASVVNVVGSRPATFGDSVFPGVVLVCSFAVGRALWGGRALAVELEGRNRRMAAEREHRARLAIAEERTRIARELQVVVAGNVSEMVLAAELAQRLLDEDVAGATRAMEVVEETGRTALTEMRQILGVLRGPDEPALAPQPGLGAVHGLLERARQQGRRVDLTVEGEPGPLPASVELAAYRVVEETLTQHHEAVEAAPGLEIRFVFGEHDLRLVLTETAPAHPARPGRLGAAPAMIAIRERVAACHGHLAEDVAPDGGRELRVSLPTDSTEVFV